MINYRLATEMDNTQLLDLTSSTPMSGIISLRIDRNPNFFKLLKYRGESKVFVASKNQTIIGCVCVTKEQTYVNEKTHWLYYVCDLKVSQPFRNKGVGRQLTNEVTKFLTIEKADLVFLNVSKGNKMPYRFFKDCPNHPDLKNIGSFKIFQFIGSKSKNPTNKYKIEKSDISLELINFLNKYYIKYELGEVITKELLEDTSLYTLRINSKIIAVMSVFDTMGAKQNVVVKLPTYLKYFLQFINRFGNRLSISQMPEEHEPIRMLYIKYLAVPTYDKNLVRILVNHAKNIAYNNSYSFVSLGLHEKDPLIKSLKGMFKITFHSLGMLVSLKGNNKLIEQIQSGVPFKDYSIV